MNDAVHIQELHWSAADGAARLRFEQRQAMLFDLDFQLQLLDANGAEQLSRHIRQAGWDISWLPAGRYELTVRPDTGRLPAGPLQLKITVSSDANTEVQHHAIEYLDVQLDDHARGAISQDQWTLASLDGRDLDQLSWRKGGGDWFYLHFDHAARVIVDLLLARSPLLKGRILDVGCGDGVTDLGVFLRCQPESLTGVDPFRGYERLPQILEDNGLPASVLDDPRLNFEPHSGNELPYPDNEFDVVLSWGSLEHIAGGYEQTLQEIHRVLKPGGLFFVHPGLFYSTLGNHLNEFFDDPFIHLKIPREELREQVLSTRPDYMDRSGYFAEPEDYWRWYTELNPITVPQIEKQLRSMGFEPWRVALRTADLVEYTPELQNFSMDDLAIAEMYAAFVLKTDQS